MQIIPWRPKAKRLSDALSFHFLANDHIQVTKKGHLLATIAFTPSDTAGRVSNQIITGRNGLNSVIGALGSNFAQWIENQRTELLEYDLAEQYPDPVSELVDKTRKHTFTKPGTQFRNRHYYSVLYAPESDLSAKITSKFEQKSKDKSKKDEKAVRGTQQISEQHVNAFEDVISRLHLGLSGCMEKAHILRGDEISTYLRSCVSTKPQYVKMPPIPCLLDGWLPSQDYTGGYDPAFHDHDGTTYIKTITVRDTPEEIFPGILARLNKLPIPYRHVVRMMTLDASEARKTLIKRISALDASSSSISENIVARFTKEKPPVAPDIQVKIDQATQAVAELGHGIIVWGYYTHSITLWNKDPHLLAEAVRYVEAEFTARGFITDVPRAQTSTWIGTIPGHPHGNLTRLLKCSLNVCDLAPVQGVWEGPKRDEHLKGPALLRATDDDKTAFNLALHQPGADVGHVAVLGEIGCHAKGTSILMADGQLCSVEDVTIGDQVMGPDSNPKTVLRLHRGVDDMYRVTPVKGDQFVVNGNHILSLERTYDGRSDGGGPLVNITVNDWLKRHNRFKGLYKLYRRGVDQFYSNESILPIEPYTLGAIIGDGCIKKLCISNPDSEVQQELRSIAAASGSYSMTLHYTPERCATLGFRSTSRRHNTNPITAGLRALGLEDASASEKFVPDIYKVSSLANRLRILAGLMDTDGHLSKSGYDFISKSKALAEDVAFLSRSVGLAAYVNRCVKSCQNGFSGEYWRVSISGNTDIIPCLVERKKAPARKQKKSVLRTGFSVEPVGKGEYFGFECDGDHLYLDGSFTVHHNSGKTSLLSSMVLAHRKYDRSRIRIFDRGATMKNACLLLGGTSYGLGSYDDNVSLQPLAFVDNPQEAMWAFGFICGLLEKNKVEVDGIVQGDVTKAIEDLSHMDPCHRTMTQLSAQCQWPQVKTGLEVFCKGGALGDLLDNDTYRLGTADIAHFEIDKLVNSEGGMALSAVIPCIFRDIERNYDGAPTLLVIDEAKQFITHKLIAERLDELYRRSRKEKIHIVLATHTINDIYGSGVKDILEQSCKSYIFAANPSATEDRPFQALLELGLTSEQIKMIARLQPKREYIFKTQGVWRKFRLELSPLELSLIGRASDADRKMMDVLYARHGPEEYPWAWLRYCGHAESEIRDWKRMVGLVPKEDVAYGVAAE